MNQKEQLLTNIGIVSFTMVDLALYLDTHPYDAKAMEYYNHYNKLYKQFMKEFSQKFYPLTMAEADSNREWRWGAAPLPWEGVCG